MLRFQQDFLGQYQQGFSDFENLGTLSVMKVSINAKYHSEYDLPWYHISLILYRIEHKISCDSYNICISAVI